jgi:hypothetical protein
MAGNARPWLQLATLLTFWPPLPPDFTKDSSMVPLELATSFQFRDSPGMAARSRAPWAVMTANRSVLAHHAIDARIEEPIQIQVRIQGPQQR